MIFRAVRRGEIELRPLDEGVLRNKSRWGGQSYDMAVFAFVPADFDLRSLVQLSRGALVEKV